MDNFLTFTKSQISGMANYEVIEVEKKIHRLLVLVMHLFSNV